jgi:hypothetical protein
MVKLYKLGHRDRFVWNGITYTVYSQAYQMTEVFGNGRFWAWPNTVKVTPVEIIHRNS